MKTLKGEIKFIHSDGKEYHFVTEINQLTQHQMFSYDNWGSCFAGTLSQVKNIIRNIRKKAKIISSTLK